MAQRVNTKFIAVALSLVLGIGAAGYVARHFVRANPAPHIQAAEKFLSEGNLEQARVEYGTAFALDRHNAEVAWKLGNIIKELMKTNDAYNGRQVENFYNAALEADPTYKPAMESLLDIYAEAAKANEDAERFTRLKDTATKLLNLDPKNSKALIYEHIAAIMTWTYSQEPDTGQIVGDIDALHALMASDPGNPDLPLYIAKAYINEGALAIRAESPSEAHEDFQHAIAIFDEAIKSNPDKALIYYDAFTVHRDIAPQDKQVTDTAAGLADQRQLLEKAIALVKPTDANYRQIYYAAQDFARQRMNAVWAEKIMRDWVSARPDDPYARLLLGQIVNSDPKRREEAIQILTKPSDTNKPGFPPIADRATLELATLIELCDLRLELYSSLDPKTDADRRKELLQQVGDGIQRATDRAGEDWRVTMLKGRLEMLQNGEGSVAAVKLFEKTLDLRRSQQNSDANDAHKYRIMYWLACCYAAINQSGPAEANLYEVVDKAPDYWPARLRLAQLLVQHDAILQARAQIDELWKRIPNNLDLIRITLLVLDPNVEVDRKRALDLYGKLPETTRVDMIIKVNSAARMGMTDETLRLARAIWDKDNTDFDSLRRLVQVLTVPAINKKDEAVAIATKAAQDNSKDPRFEFLLANLKGAPAAQMDEIYRRIIEAEPDPHSRELKWFQYLQQQGKADEAFTHLQAAEKVAPDDASIMDLMFQHYCLLKDWNKARDYAIKLGAANFDGAGGELYQIELDKEQGKYDEELSLARDVAKKYPEVERSWVALGEAMMMNQQFDTAIQNYTLALEKRKDSVPAYRGLVECSVRLGRMDDARRYLNTALKLHPDDALFHEQLVEVDLQTDPERAIAPRLQSMKDSPRSRDAHVNLWQAYYKSGLFVQQKGQNDKANEYFKLARDVLTDVVNDPEWSDDPHLYGFLAGTDVSMQDIDGGRKVLEKLATVDKWKDTAVPSVMLAQFWAQCNKPTEAEAAWKEAMVKSKNALDVTQQLATFYVQHNRVDDAIALLTPRIKEQGIAPELIEIEINSGHYAEAQHQLETILNTPGQVRDPLLVSWLGLANLNQNKLPEAEALLNESIQLAPKSPMPHLWRANVKMKQATPDLDAALDDLKAALDLDPNNVDVRVSLAELYQRRDDMDSAMHELEQSVQLAPMRKDVRLRLVDMYSNQTPPRWVEVNDLLEKARQIDPNDLDWILHQANVALQRGMPDVAEQRADELMKQGPNNPAVFREFLTILLRAKRYDRALSETDTMMNTAKDQTPWWVHMGRGVALAGLDRKDDAMVEFKTALDISAPAPDADAIATQIIQRMVEVIGPQRALEFALPQTNSDNRWRLIAVNLYDRLQRYPEAAALADKILASSDSIPPAERTRITIQLAQIYISDKDVQKGVQLYRDLLAKNPDNLLALNNLAVALVDEITPPQTQEALDCSTKMLAALPKYDALFSADRYNFLDTHGWVLVKSGRQAEGLPYLYAAANAHISVACYHLGVVLMGQSRATDAHKWLQDAHDLMEKDVQNQRPYSPALRAAIDAQLSQF